MYKIINISLLLPMLIILFLNCTDAYNTQNCQFTLIVSTINKRTDTIKVEILYHSIDTLEPNADIVFIGHHEYQGRDVCLSPSELILVHNTYIRSTSATIFDSLIQTDTIDPSKFSYDLGETNILEEVEVLIK